MDRFLLRYFVENEDPMPEPDSFRLTRVHVVDVEFMADPDDAQLIFEACQFAAGEHYEVYLEGVEDPQVTWERGR